MDLKQLTDQSAQNATQAKSFSLADRQASTPVTALPTPVIKQSLSVAKYQPSQALLDKQNQNRIDRLAQVNTVGDLSKTQFAASSIDPNTVTPASQPSFWDTVKNYAVAPVKAAIQGIGWAANQVSAGVSAVENPVASLISTGIEKAAGTVPGQSFWDTYKQNLGAGLDFTKGISSGNTAYNQAINATNMQNTILGNPVVGFGANVLLDPTNYLGGAEALKLISKGGDILKLTEAGKAAYAARIAEVGSELQKGSKVLSNVQKEQIAQSVIEELASKKAAGEAENLFAKPGIGIRGTNKIIPGTAQLQEALKIGAATTKAAALYIPSVKQIGAVAEKALQGAGEIAGKTSQLLKQHLDDIYAESVAARQQLVKDVQELTGRTAKEKNVLWDQNFGSVAEGIDQARVMMQAEKLGNDVHRLSDAEEYLIHNRAQGEQYLNEMRPWAQKTAKKIWGLVDDALGSEIKAGAPKAVFYDAAGNLLEQKYMPQAIAGRGISIDELKKQAEAALPDVTGRILSSGATKADVAAKEGLDALASGKYDKTPWFHQPRVFSDMEAQKAAGFKPATLTDALTRRLQGSSDFTFQRAATDKIFTIGGKEVRPAAQASEAELNKAATQLGDKQHKIVQVTDEVTGKQYEIPESLRGVVAEYNKNYRGNPVFTINSPTLRKVMAGYDNFNAVFKALTTVWFAGYYVRNVMSDMARVIMSQGLYATVMRPGALMDVGYLLRDNLPKELAAQKVTYGGLEFTYKQLHDYIWKKGVLQSHVRSEFPMLYGGLFGKYGQAGERAPRILAFLQGLESTGDIRAAAASSRKILFDYSKLTPFEKQVMQRVIPFYGFKRLNFSYNMDLLASKPQVFNTIGKAYKQAETYATQQQPDLATSPVPSWISRSFYVPLPLGQDNRGRNTYLSELGMPWEDFNATTSIMSKDGIQNALSQLNPLIKYPIEASTTRSLFTGNQVVPSDARTQMLALKSLNTIAPGFVNYQEKVDAQGNKYYSANPQAIILISNLPTSRLTQTADSLAVAASGLFPNIPHRQDKGPLETATRLLSGIGVQRVNPESSWQADTIEQAQALRDIYYNMGVIRQSRSDNLYYVDYGSTIGDNSQTSAYLKTDAQNVLNLIKQLNRGYITSDQNASVQQKLQDLQPQL